MASYAEAAERFARADAADPAKPEQKKFQAWRDSQLAAFELWDTRDDQRLLLYYPTGTGKSKTALTMLWVRGYTKVIVLAPPKTAAAWRADANVLDMQITVMSHMKFRQPDTKLPRDVPIIVDEFHLLGKHGAVGMKKFDRMVTRFPAVILCSATPNYNDAERCYNIAHSIDPLNNSGGFLKWVYEHCETRVNPFAATPYVDGFKNYDGASDFLASQPYTAYIEDTASWVPDELVVTADIDLSVFNEYHYSARHHRITNSQMEWAHMWKRLFFLDDSEKRLRLEIAADLLAYMEKAGGRKYLIFAASRPIAEATAHTLQGFGYTPFFITGALTDTQARQMKEQFIATGDKAVMIGTASLATGVDGLDGVCNHLIELDPTNDGSMRRQLIGRVLPRGGYERETFVTTVVTRTSHDRL